MNEKLKALIVDDEMDVCFLLSNVLKSKNFAVHSVHSIGEARATLIQESPSVIFLDNHLPDGFGINFISEIKGNIPQVKIVMITAYDTKMDREKAYTEGADYFIGKPFNREDIFQAIDHTMKLKNVEL